MIGNSDTSVSTLPSNIVIDRCLLWGNGTGSMVRGVSANGVSIAVVNSYLYNFAQTDADSQAIAAWNSPGPIKIANNFLEGSTENVMFGGADPSIPNLVNSDIEIRQNHFFKPLSWNPGDPTYAGTKWQVKDLFELKNAQRVLLEGNIMENNWAEAQDGFAVLFTPRKPGGRYAPGAPSPTSLSATTSCRTPAPVSTFRAPIAPALAVTVQDPVCPPLTSSSPMSWRATSTTVPST